MNFESSKSAGGKKKEFDEQFLVIPEEKNNKQILAEKKLARVETIPTQPSPELSRMDINIAALEAEISAARKGLSSSTVDVRMMGATLAQLRRERAAMRGNNTTSPGNPQQPFSVIVASPEQSVSSTESEGVKKTENERNSFGGEGEYVDWLENGRPSAKLESESSGKESTEKNSEDLTGEISLEKSKTEVAGDKIKQLEKRIVVMTKTIRSRYYKSKKKDPEIKKMMSDLGEEIKRAKKEKKTLESKYKIAS